FASTFRWNHIYNPKLFSNTTIYTGTYGNRLFLTPNYWKSGIGLLGFKMDFTHFSSEKVQSKFGMEVLGYFNDPGTISLDTSIAILPSLKPNYARKTVLYYQGEWAIRERLKLTAGVRVINWANLGPATYYRFDQQHQVKDTVSHGAGIYHFYFHADPRLSLQYRLDESSQLKVSFGRYHQYLQMISNSVSPFTPLEVWLPASPNVEPQVSLQWSLGYLKFFEQAKMEISAAVYHKKMDNQIDYDGHAQTYVNPLLEGELRFGTTRASGFEFLLKKDFGRLNGWMAYNYSRVFRQTEGLNDGKVYRAFQDRPHDFSLFLNYQPKKRVLYSAYWTSYSGSTFTSPIGFLDFNNQTVPVFGERNNDRLPAYHRLDLSVQFNLNKDETQRYQHNLTLSVNNFLAHKNVFA
ncbi:MAG: TonB-dependent receptor, partial [Bacteroidetes bacterium]|nr:TonB-dependent receptor [Bacteroidota bacterium]